MNTTIQSVDEFYADNRADNRPAMLEIFRSLGAEQTLKLLSEVLTVEILNGLREKDESVGFYRRVNREIEGVIEKVKTW